MQPSEIFPVLNPQPWYWCCWCFAAAEVLKQASLSQHVNLVQARLVTAFAEARVFDEFLLLVVANEACQKMKTFTPCSLVGSQLSMYRCIVRCKVQIRCPKLTYISCRPSKYIDDHGL